MDPRWTLGNEEMDDDATTDGATSAIYYAGSNLSSAFAMEDQKQQIFGICEIVQSDIKMALDRIARIIHFMTSNRQANGDIGSKPLELLSEYQVFYIFL